MRFRPQHLALTIAIFASVPALAQDGAQNNAQDRAGDVQSTQSAPLAKSGPELDVVPDSLTIAVGAATVPRFEGSAKNVVIPVGLVRGSVSGISFWTRGPQLLVDLVPNKPGPTWDIQLGPVAGVNFDRIRRGVIGDSRVEALGRRNLPIEIGGFAGIAKTGVITSDYDTLTASIVYTHDVNNAHRSYLITPQLDYGTPLSSRAYVGVSANATYVGEGYANAYFSVTPAQSLLSTLPTYAAGKGWKNYSLTVFGSYALTGDLRHGLSVIAGVSYWRLLGDIADSPIVSIAGNRNQWLGGAGLAYNF